MRQCFNSMLRYGRLMLEALLEGIRPEDVCEWVVAEAPFREISGDPDLLYDLMEKMLPIQTAREEERRILGQGRMWSEGHANGTGGSSTRGDDDVPGSGDSGISSRQRSARGGSSGGFYHGRGNGGHLARADGTAVSAAAVATMNTAISAAEAVRPSGVAEPGRRRPWYRQFRWRWRSDCRR